VDEEVAMVLWLFLLGDFMLTEAERWRRFGMVGMEGSGKGQQTRQRVEHIPLLIEGVGEGWNMRCMCRF